MVLKLLIKIIFDSDSENMQSCEKESRTGVKMLEFVLRELAKPIIRRLGTSAAAVLVGMGYASEQTIAVETALTSVGLVLIDLVLSHKARK